ncbi:heme-binding protein [Pseudomonas sp. SA3-5]|uniref:Heme-binding protein n=1 Tax=Pseudomonas aestuarii TaxID=3018340 RepID=A0ABT4XD20_9PSED|nr:heme-binding protein [Pseudomonas aestuarii]MDA7086098.1 heme-binding protein [Pseudomonas aestuarii]
MKSLASLTLTTLGALSLQAQAEVVSERNISQSLAAQIVTVAVHNCAAQGYNVAATVVDRAGNVRAVLRADNAGPHTVDASRRKAYTSASTKAPTSAVLAMVQKNPGAQYLPMIDDFLVLGGGLPIKFGDQVIGAVGIGGAPGGHLDEQCASAALQSVEGELK